MSGGEWEDEEEQRGEQCASESARSSKSKKTKRRSQNKKLGLRAAFDAGEQFRDDTFSFMGLHLAPASADRDSGGHVKSIDGYRLPAHCRVLRLSVEGGVPAGGRELFDRIQVQTLKDGQVPEVLTVEGQELDVAYSCPDGDELSFAAHSQDIQWIGDRFIGTILVSHKQEPTILTDIRL